MEETFCNRRGDILWRKRFVIGEETFCGEKFCTRKRFVGKRLVAGNVLCQETLCRKTICGETFCVETFCKCNMVRWGGGLSAPCLGKPQEGRPSCWIQI